MLPKCKFMFVLCDVFGRFEVLDSAVVFFFMYSNDSTVHDGSWFYLKVIYIYVWLFPVPPAILVGDYSTLFKRVFMLFEALLLFILFHL